jgi:hypothetical protein
MHVNKKYDLKVNGLKLEYSEEIIHLELANSLHPKTKTFLILEHLQPTRPQLIFDHQFLQIGKASTKIPPYFSSRSNQSYPKNFLLYTIVANSRYFSIKIG